MARIFVEEPGIFGDRCSITDESSRIIGMLHLNLSSFIGGSSGAVVSTNGQLIYQSRFNFGMWDEPTRRHMAILFVQEAFPGNSVSIAGDAPLTGPISPVEFLSVLRELLPSTPQHPSGTLPATISLDTLTMMARELYPGRTSNPVDFQRAVDMINADLVKRGEAPRLEWSNNTLVYRPR